MFDHRDWSLTMFPYDLNENQRKQKSRKSQFVYLRHRQNSHLKLLKLKGCYARHVPIQQIGKSITKPKIPLILWYESKTIQKKNTATTSSIYFSDTHENLGKPISSYSQNQLTPQSSPNRLLNHGKNHLKCFGTSILRYTQIFHQPELRQKDMNSQLTTSTPAKKQHVSKQTCLLLQTWICSALILWKSSKKPILPNSGKKKGDFPWYTP